MLESATIGVVGAALGLAVGFVTAWLWIRIHFRQLLGYYVEYHFAYGMAAWYTILVLVMTLIAGYAAARMATRRSVLVDLRDE
jgi:ABC-type antimicrobial peptide transport system permease subunit